MILLWEWDLKEILSLPNDNELKKIDNKEDYLEESIFCKNTDVLYILEYFKPCLNQDEINVLENYARVSARFLGLRIELIKHSCKAIKDSIKKRKWDRFDALKNAFCLIGALTFTTLKIKNLNYKK